MAKSILKNSIFNVANKGFNVIYPMVTSVYISRIFLADGVGTIMFAINIVTYFSLVASLGLPNYALKVISGCRDNKELLNRHFTEFSLILAISSVIVSLIYYISIPFIFSHNHELIPMALILGLIIITNITNYDWLFESLEDYKFLAIRSIVVKCSLLIGMFLFVKDRSDVIIYCGIYAGIPVLNNIWNVFSFHRFASYKIKAVRLFSHIKPISFLFAAAFATEIYTLLDSTMLGIMCKPEYLGYYSNASRIVRASYGLLFAIIAVYNPRLSYLFSTKNYKAYRTLFQQYYNIALILSFPFALFLFFASKPITIFMFGYPFLPVAVTLKILSLLIIVFTMATVFGHYALIIYGKEKLLLIGTIAGAIVNYTLNQLLIPILQQNGAAIASVLSEVIVTCILIFFSLKCFRIQLFNKNFAQVLFAAFSSIIVTSVFALLDISSNLYMILGYFFSVYVTFSLVLYFFKNEIFVIIARKLNIKL